MLEKSTTNKSVNDSDAGCPDNESVDRLYFCPLCDTLADAGTIACEQCDEWFHFKCVGLQDKEIEKIGDSIPYVCDACSDNVLYGSIPNSPNVSLNENGDQNITRSVEKNSQNETQFIQKDNILIDSHETIESNESIVENRTVLKEVADQTYMHNLINPQNETLEKVTHVVTSAADNNQSPLNSYSQQQKRKAKGTPASEVESIKQKRTNQKKINNKEETEHKIYIIDLERKIKEQEKTINLLTQRMNLNVDQASNINDEPSQGQNDGIKQPAVLFQPLNAGNSDAHYQMMDMRMKQIEMNLLQNVSVFTLCTAQMSMQLQNQNAMLNNLYSQQNHYTRYNHPYQAPSLMPSIPYPIPPAPHFMPPAPHFMPPTPHFMPPAPHSMPPAPHFMPPPPTQIPTAQQPIPQAPQIRPTTAFPPPGSQKFSVQQMVFPDPKQLPGQSSSVQHYAPVRPAQPHIYTEERETRYRWEKPHESDHMRAPTTRLNAASSTVSVSQGLCQKSSEPASSNCKATRGYECQTPVIDPDSLNHKDGDNDCQIVESSSNESLTCGSAMAVLKDNTSEMSVTGLELKAPSKPQDPCNKPVTPELATSPSSCIHTQNSPLNGKQHFLRIPSLDNEPPDQIILDEPQVARL